MFQMLRLPSVLDARGRGREAHYSDIREGLCTPPVLIGHKAVAWPSYEIEALNRARIAGKSDEEIRALVAQLVDARAKAAA